MVIGGNNRWSEYQQPQQLHQQQLQLQLLLLLLEQEEQNDENAERKDMRYKCSGWELCRLAGVVGTVKTGQVHRLSCLPFRLKIQPK